MNIVSQDQMRNYIVKKRKQQGLTQKQLAKRAGVSQSLLSKFESNTTNPTYEAIYKIVQVVQKPSETIEKYAKKAVCVKPTDTVQQAINIMKQNDYSQLIVKNKGIIGRIETKHILEAKNADPISKHMKQPYPHLPINTPIAIAIQLLKTHQAITTQQGKIVTRADIL